VDSQVNALDKKLYNTHRALNYEENNLNTNTGKLSKIKNNIKKLSRNSKLGLAAAGLGATGLAYNYFKNN
jgi:hypothetical protein